MARRTYFHVPEAPLIPHKYNSLVILLFRQMVFAIGRITHGWSDMLAPSRRRRRRPQIVL